MLCKSPFRHNALKPSWFRAERPRALLGTPDVLAPRLRALRARNTVISLDYLLTANTMTSVTTRMARMAAMSPRAVHGPRRPGPLDVRSLL